MKPHFETQFCQFGRRLRFVIFEIQVAHQNVRGENTLKAFKTFSLRNSSFYSLSFYTGVKCTNHAVLVVHVDHVILVFWSFRDPEIFESLVALIPPDTWHSVRSVVLQLFVYRGKLWTDPVDRAPRSCFMVCFLSSKYSHHLSHSAKIAFIFRLGRHFGAILVISVQSI